MKFKYKIDGTKNGRLLIENAHTIFEDNTKDINFIYCILYDFKEKHPDYIAKMEQFYGKDIDYILKKFEDSKEDLRKAENGFLEMIESVNKFNKGGRPLVAPKTNPKILPKTNPEVVEILKNGHLDDKTRILLDFINKREKKNSENISDIKKFWEGSSEKQFEDDINSLRKNSITFIKEGLLRILTKQKQLVD